MHEHLAHAVTVFMGFFAIMNPIANTPIFLGLTQNDDAKIRRAVARRAMVATFVIVFAFAVSGNLIFNLFGIGLASFKITGGLVVMLIGFHMLQGKSSAVQNPASSNGQPDLAGEMDKAISPLAMPILAGPGTIATAITFSSGGGFGRTIVTLAAFLLLCIITYFAFVRGERLVRYLGHEGMSVVTRLMGLILAVIGTQMVVDGIVSVAKAAS